MAEIMKKGNEMKRVGGKNKERDINKKWNKEGVGRDLYLTSTPPPRGVSVHDPKNKWDAGDQKAKVGRVNLPAATLQYQVYIRYLQIER